ncbi:UbiH/UbiF family hydroxylase [Leeia oryzae]|uniref:UbiH/UbiF family hydroxylase n=1 Tax=Leeia oryzae TaxID=356662 RepID=UPI00039F0594|nr:UbiH/UbiF family hydroxylase [Leeia oryzae]
MTQSFDIVIVGGGLVGASLACRLSASAFSVALIEGQTPPDDPYEWDQRIYAISRGSRRYLQDCGAWQRLDASRCQPVNQMQIFGDERSELVFDADNAHLSELAIILESRHLQKAIWEGLPGHDKFTLIQPARPVSIHYEQDRAVLALDNQQTLSARLIVGADGARSWVRQQIQSAKGRADQPKPYGQKGVVANFDTEKSHQGIAWQWFQADGSILAWLPLPGNRMSMVWSAQDPLADELCQLAPEQLAQRVAEAGGYRLGKLTPITPAVGFPLRALVLPDLVGQRLALVGDAAHLVHPLAGQGVNLGFQDARDLADLLLKSPSVDPGSPSFLQRYERNRRFDILAMDGVTKNLHRLFNASGAAPKWLRNVGLNLTNRVPAVKQALIRQALG